MNKWDKLLSTRHSKYYGKPSQGELFCNAGMSKQAIADLKRQSDFKWSKEFFSLYELHDGVGIRMDDGSVSWSFVPSGKLIEFKRHVVQWFDDTHPAVANAFFPFFDWGNGDVMGYVNVKGVEGILFEFSHEEYNSDADQDHDEFLKPAFETIADLLCI